METCGPLDVHWSRIMGIEVQQDLVHRFPTPILNYFNWLSLFLVHLYIAFLIKKDPCVWEFQVVSHLATD